MHTDVQQSHDRGDFLPSYQQSVPLERMPVPVNLPDETQVHPAASASPVVERLVYVPIRGYDKNESVSPVEILEAVCYLVGSGAAIGVVVAFIIYPEAIMILGIVLGIAAIGWLFSLFDSSWKSGFDQSRHIDRIPFGGGNTTNNQSVSTNYGNVQQNSGGDNRQYVFNNCKNVKIN